MQALRSKEKVAAYRILFFNCGSAVLKWVNAYPDIGHKLRGFVLAGGSLYASDLSWAYLEAAFPAPLSGACARRPGRRAPRS